MRELYRDEWVTLYHGDGLAWSEPVDAVITDPPYSERTHAASLTTGSDGSDRRSLDYASWSHEHMAEAVRAWTRLARGWIVVMTDAQLAGTVAAEQAERYVFTPLAYLVPGSRVRLMGDGPAQWSVWIVASRPRGGECARWGSLPGGYVLPPGHREDKALPGGKEEWIMRELVRDYSREGDTVLDPCCGAGTTLVAARDMRRKAIGIEMDEATAMLAAARLRRTAGRMVQREML